MQKHLPNLIIAVWATLFFGSILLISRLVRPTRNGKQEDRAFDCGEVTREIDEDTPWIRISARFHGLVSISAVFLVGLLFLYPAAVVFRQHILDGKGASAFSVLLLFFGTLWVAVAYARTRGDLSWVRKVEKPPR